MKKDKLKTVTQELVTISAMINDILGEATFPYTTIHKVQALVDKTNLILNEANKEEEEKKEGESEKAN